MIPNSRSQKEYFQAKQEGENTANNEGSISKRQSSSSKQWTSAFRNPRIVRVSRSFGGKDRHSKVCTVRGLRDRRIRLSVPTAVQLYDLQDRLNLSQPSKVIDWLLEVAKDDVDKLPPLQFPQGFGQLYPNMMYGTHDQSWDGANLLDLDQASRQNLGIGGSSLRPRSYKEVEKDDFGFERGKWIKGDDHEQHDDGIDIDQNHFSLGQSSRDKLYPSLLSNQAMTCNSYHHFSPSNLSLSQLGNHGYLPQAEISISSSSSTSNAMNNLPSGSQLFFCPPATMASLFPTYPPFVTAQLGDGNESVRQFNHFQILNSNLQQFLPNSSIKPFHQLMNMNPGFGGMEGNNEDCNNNNDDSDS